MNENVSDRESLGRLIGRRVKELRKEGGMRLKELAKLSGLSASLLSRLENGKLIPSLISLHHLANILKVEINYFFHEDKDKRWIIAREGHRKTVKSRKGTRGQVAYEIELLSEGIDNPFMEPVIATLVGKDEEINPVRHGGQEFMYVLKGKMEIELQGKRFLLAKGDTIYFDGNVPHKAISKSQKPARVMAVHFIPAKRMGSFVS